MGYDAVAINIDLGDISDYYTEVCSQSLFLKYKTTTLLQLDSLWTPASQSNSEGEPPKKKKKKQQRKDELADGIAGILV